MDQPHHQLVAAVAQVQRDTAQEDLEMPWSSARRSENASTTRALATFAHAWRVPELAAVITPRHGSLHRPPQPWAGGRHPAGDAVTDGLGDEPAGHEEAVEIDARLDANVIQQVDQVLGGQVARRPGCER